MMSSKFVVCFLAACSSCLAQTAPLNLYESVEPHMGTLFQIKLYAANAELAQAAFTAAFARVTELDNELSDYKPDSELNLAAKSAYSHPVVIGNDLATVLKASLQMSEATDGAFDVTVGPLSRLWRTARHDHALPPADAIESARKLCGYRKLHLNAATQTITLDSPDMQLDLGAIAKGYAADEALAVINRLGISRALVAASGDLAFGDPPPGKSGWRIGIGASGGALTLANAAVSTSGGTQQYLDANGKRYSHIIDPKTGMGLTTDITVTAVSRRGVIADAADTAVSVLGCEKGLAFIETRPDIAAVITETVDGQAHSIESTRFRRLPH